MHRRVVATRCVCEIVRTNALSGMRCVGIRWQEHCVGDATGRILLSHCVWQMLFQRCTCFSNFMRGGTSVPWRSIFVCFLGIGWNTVGAKMGECLHRCVLSRFIGIALHPAYARADSGAVAVLRVCLCFPWHWMEYRGREDGAVCASMCVPRTTKLLRFFTRSTFQSNFAQSRS